MPKTSSNMIITSTVKGITTICCVDEHDYSNDASEDDERAEAGFGSFLRRPSTLARCITAYRDNLLLLFAFFARSFPIALYRIPHKPL